AAATLDLFLTADLGILVTSPEPPSIEGTYRFACALFQRRLRRALVRDRFKGRMADRAQADLPPLPSPLDVLRALARYDSALVQLAARELAEIRPRLLVNDVRLRTDAEVSPGMVDLAHRYLGVAFDPVGSVEHDDAVWLSVVRRRPLLVDSPASKGGRNFERVARRVVALLANRDAARPEVPTPAARPEPNLYDVLLVHRSATDEELRRAYKRQRELFQSGSLPLTSLLSEDALRAEQARIEEAHDTLLDPLRRRAYDLSTFPDPEPEVEPRTAEQSAAHRAELELLRAEIARELSAETEFTGDLLRRVREAQGTEIEEIARRTKISAAHLRAIEAEEFSRLPAIVYARGFLTEVAKCLGLDPTQVTRTYLRRLRERSRASDGAGS
ncbi:MAG: helix-turn-helix domain-containing protein, partial [Deltaproteobacteria bacterium]|nr:helix-turn-helix domain-containing protein [Deltaproteobacteria bacterium]